MTVYALVLSSPQVKWPDVLLSMRYQKNLLGVYRAREKTPDKDKSKPGRSGGNSSSGRRMPAARNQQQKKNTDPGKGKSSAAAGFSPPGSSSPPSKKKRKSGSRGSGTGGLRGGGGGDKDRPASPSSSSPGETIMPRHHFHGPTFHALLHEYRLENSAEAKRLRREASAEQEEEEAGQGAASATFPASSALAGDAVSGDGAAVAGGGSPAGIGEGDNAGDASSFYSSSSSSPAFDTPSEDADPGAAPAAGAGVPGAIPVAVPGRPATRTTAPPAATAEALPIDAYRDEILEHVRNNRVTVIHGETGSGKSTRIPVMLVEEALDQIEAEAAAVAEAVREGLTPGRGSGGGGGGGGEDGRKNGRKGEAAGAGRGRPASGGRAAGGAGGGAARRPRMFVSQPRRAATRALVQRVRQEAEGSGRGWSVGLRLGHGVREGPPRAEVTFATTGYLARLLASNPRVLDAHTHLIIDEVRERERRRAGDQPGARARARPKHFHPPFVSGCYSGVRSMCHAGSGIERARKAPVLWLPLSGRVGDGCFVLFAFVPPPASPKKRI